MIALLGALRDELSGVTKEMTVTRRYSHRGKRLMEGRFAGRDVVLVQTGMGKDRAKQAAEYILEHYSLSVIISFGFGGSLVADLQIGDLVLCREFIHHSHLDTRHFYKSHKDLIAMATRVMEGKQVNYLAGTGLSVDQLISHPDEKAALGKTYGAQVADMESFWIAEAVAYKEIPLLGVRAISDTLDQRLPPFDRFVDAEGKWLAKHTLRHFMSNPRDLKIIPLLYVNSRQARISLTEFLRALIPEIPQEINRDSNT